MTLSFHLIPHTHWDREWYLSRAGFQGRLIPATDALIALLEREPGLRFHLDGQTVLVEDYLAVRPTQRSRLAKLVERGVLGVGPWYVLADELIPSGESLIRNLLIGGRDGRELGSTVPVLYSPDAFGHPARLPMLAAQLGIRWAVVWRGLAAAKDLARWQAPDGSSVLVYHLPPSGYEVGSGLVGPEAELARRWSAVREHVVRRAASGQIAVLVGADHHAASERLASLRDRLRAMEPANQVRVSSLTEFFTAVEAENPVLPHLEGELRWSYGHTWTLQGIHATRSRLKRRHTEVELFLQRTAEPLAALAAWRGGADRSDLARHVWRGLVQSQFHDTIAGTTTDAVAREQEVRLKGIGTVAQEIGLASIADLTGHDPDRARETPSATRPTLFVWNPAARARTGIVVAELTGFRADVIVGPPSDRRARRGSGLGSFHLSGVEGPVPVQILGRSEGLERIDAPRHYPDLDRVDRVFVAFRARVGGLGGCCLTLAPATRAGPRGGSWARDRAIGNELIEARVDPFGRIRLTDRLRGPSSDGLLGLISEWDGGDTYTPSIRGRTELPLTVGRIDILAQGPLVSGLAWHWSLGGTRRHPGRVRGRTVLSVHADSPILRIRLDLDNGIRDHRLRVAFPIGHGGRHLVGTSFGAIERTPVRSGGRGAEAERPVPTGPAQRYVAGAESPKAGRIGLLGPGTFEYEWSESGVAIVTLIRSIGELSKNDLPERPGHAGWPEPTPLAQEQGVHRIELAVAPLGDDSTARPSLLERLWEDAFLPPQAIWLRNFCGRPNDVPGVELEGPPDLICVASKPAEDGRGLILRCQNLGPDSGRGSWILREPIARAARVRADETEVEPLEVKNGVVPFDFGPHQLVSVAVYR